MTLENDSQKPLRDLPGIRRIDNLPALPERPTDAHKGSFGSVLIVAGSVGMAGAACLAGQAALHGGAGLVSVAIPRSISTIVAMAHSSYMTILLDDDENGRITEDAVPQLETALPRQSAIAIGPGLGHSNGAKKAIQHLYQNISLPMVLDADGLNAYSGEASNLLERIEHAPRILTPHPGEFSRLTGFDTRTIQLNRVPMAVEFAKTHEIVLVLKGAGTVITDGTQLAINTTGNCGLATGGSGDVLTGIIASLLAQRMDAFQAAQLAVYLHGLAGDLASADLTDRYTTSKDLLHYLSAAWRQLIDAGEK